MRLASFPYNRFGAAPGTPRGLNREFRVDSSRAAPTVRPTLARMAELADAVDSKSTAP